MGQVAKDKIEIGVVLQGGGALGAYEFGAMIALLELMDEIDVPGRTVRLVAVTGVSIGAINAACVVGAKDRADARRRLRVPVVRSVAGDPELLVGGCKPQSRIVRRARLLCAAPRCLEFLRLDEFLRHRSDARNAERARGLRLVERQRDRFCRHRGRCVLRRIDPLSQSSAQEGSQRPRSGRAMCWRAAACRRRFRQPRSTTRVSGTAGSSTTRRSATRSMRFPDRAMSIAS